MASKDKMKHTIMEEKLQPARAVIRSNNLNTCRGARVRLQPALQCKEGKDAWQRAVVNPDALIAIDLFCGAGGLSYGFQEAQ